MWTTFFVVLQPEKERKREKKEKQITTNLSLIMCVLCVYVDVVVVCNDGSMELGIPLRI